LFRNYNNRGKKAKMGDNENSIEQVPAPDENVLDINDSSRCPFTGGAI